MPYSFISFLEDYTCQGILLILFLFLRNRKTVGKGCLHLRLEVGCRSNKSGNRVRIRKCDISKPILVESPTSLYSFDEKRPTPTPSIGKSKFSSESNSSTDSGSSTSSDSAALESTSATLVSRSEDGEKDGKSEWKEEYLTQREISGTKTQITRFVGGLTSYGQLIEKTHAALHADILAILNLIPPPPIPVPEPPTETEPEVTKISLLSSHRSRLTKIPPSYIPPSIIPTAVSLAGHSLQCTVSCVPVYEHWLNIYRKMWPPISSVVLPLASRPFFLNEVVGHQEGVEGRVAY